MIENDFIKLCDTYEKIIIYGAGMVGKLAHKRLISHQMGEKIVSFAVSGVVSETERVQGKKVCQITSLLEVKEEALVIIATLQGSHIAIEKTLEKLEFKHILKIEEELFNSLSEAYINDFKNKNVHVVGMIDVLLMASDNNASSGAFLCMADLSEELNQKGIRTLIILPVYGDGEEVLIKNGLPYTYVSSRNWVYPIEQLKSYDYTKVHEENLPALEEIKRICQEHQVKLIHNNTTYTYIGAVVAKELNIPIIWHLREDVLVQCCDFIDRKKAIEFINQSDKVLVVSHFIQETISGLKKENTQVIYDGVDIRKYYLERNIFENSNDITIIMVGAITPIKGQGELIEAMHLLQHKNCIKPKVIFLGKGDVDYLNELHQKIDQYGLQENVHFVGMRSDVESFYKDADIAVVCSQADSFGRVTVEAQLAGCAVIGGNAGATPELIKDMQTGLLYAYGDSKDLSEKILYYITQKEFAKEIARRGQVEAKKCYTKECNAKEIIKVYEKCIMKEYRMESRNG